MNPSRATGNQTERIHAREGLVEKNTRVMTALALIRRVQLTVRATGHQRERIHAREGLVKKPTEVMRGQTRKIQWTGPLHPSRAGTLHPAEMIHVPHQRPVERATKKEVGNDTSDTRY